MWTASSLNTSSHQSKITLKSNCKDGVSKTSARDANVLPTGEMTGKGVTGTVKVSEKMNNLKKRVGASYILCCEMGQDYPTRD